MTTITTDFIGTPSQADAEGILRRYVYSTAGSTHWREEIHTVTTAGAGGSTQVSAQNVAGTTLGVSFSTGSVALVEGVFSSGGFPIYGQTTDLGSSRIPIAVTTLGEIKTVGGAGTSQVSVQNVVGTTLAVSLTSASVVKAEAQGNFGVVQITSPWVTQAGQSNGTSSVTPWFIQNDSSHALFVSPTSVTISGNSTAIISTASKIQVEPAAGTTFNIAGNTTVSGAVTISGNSTAILTTASKVLVEPAAATTFSVRPVAQPLGEFTLETGTTSPSTYGAKMTSVAGSTVLVSSGAGRVRVLSYSIQQQDASTVSQTVKFLSSGTTLVGAPDWVFSAREGVAMTAPTGGYLFQTSTGEALGFSLSTNVLTAMHVVCVRTTA